MLNWWSLSLFVVLGVVEGLPLSTLILNWWSLSLFVVLGGSKSQKRL